MKKKYCEECFSELKNGVCKDCGEPFEKKKPVVDFRKKYDEMFAPHLEGKTWFRVKSQYKKHKDE